MICSRETVELIHDFLSQSRCIDRSLDVLLMAVHHRLFPAHPGLSKKNRERPAHVLVVDRRGTCRRYHPENTANNEIAYARMQLGRANRDLALEMLSQR